MANELNVHGKMHVKTLKEQFQATFGLTLRVYDGRSFAVDNVTLVSIRKDGGKSGEFCPASNTTVGMFENEVKNLFGIEIQVAGSDDSYLCRNELTLADALIEDQRKLNKKSIGGGGVTGSIPDVSLFDNSSERTPLVLVLDCSGSMDGKPMYQLNEGLKSFTAALRSDPVTATHGRVLMITFGGNDSVSVDVWQDAMDWQPPVLEANGRTPTGAAVTIALEAIEMQKAELRAAGVSYKRPIMLLMSDGEPTDEWEEAARNCRSAELAKKVTVMTVAIGPNANTSILNAFSSKKAVLLTGLEFKEMFVWLSQSVRAVSQAASGEVAQISSISGWGTDSN